MGQTWFCFGGYGFKLCSQTCSPVFYLYCKISNIVFENPFKVLPKVCYLCSFGPLYKKRESYQLDSLYQVLSFYKQSKLLILYDEATSPGARVAISETSHRSNLAAAMWC